MAKKKTTAPVIEIVEAAPALETFVIAYKGFDKNMQCRGYQFEIGKAYEHEGKVKSCESGFHACKHPLSVFEFYPPSGSRFAEVRMSGEIDDRNSDDTKIAAARISVEIELSISDIVKRAWDYVWGKCTIEGQVATGSRGAASAGLEKIKPDTFYMLKGGKPVEVSS